MTCQVRYYHPLCTPEFNHPLHDGPRLSCHEDPLKRIVCRAVFVEKSPDTYEFDLNSAVNLNTDSTVYRLSKNLPNTTTRLFRDLCD